LRGGLAEQLFTTRARTLPGIELREAEQLRVLEEIEVFYADLDLPEKPRPDRRYYLDNQFYAYSDGIFLAGMLRRLRPRRIVEVGSGFSSAAMLDVDDAFLGSSVAMTFIEPHPERLRRLLRPADTRRVTIIEKPVQVVPLTVFQALEDRDVLFVDSTHVIKTGSDVNWLLFEILPALAPGVRIHFHDVFFPFEYPPAWVLAGVAWNEAYALRAFLQYNQSFQIEIFNTFLSRFHAERIDQSMPLCARNRGGSLWLVRR